MLPEHPDRMTTAELRAWIAHLVADRVPEGPRLDYKETQDLGRERREVAKDLSSFANEVGGTLLYGIPEDRSSDGVPIPKEPYGIPPIPDFESRVENIIVEAIQPTVPEWRILPVQVAPDRVVYVVWTPESWVGVHMVEGYQESRYYRRGQYRAVRMNEREVRDRYERLLMTRGWLESFLASPELNYLSDRLPATFRSHYVVAPIMPLVGRVNLSDPSFREWLRYNRYPSAVSQFLPSLYGARTDLRIYADRLDWDPHIEIFKNGAISHWRTASVGETDLGILALAYYRELENLLEFLKYAGHLYDALGFTGPVHIQARIFHSDAVRMSVLTLPVGTMPRDYKTFDSHDYVLRMSAEDSAVGLLSHPNQVLKRLADEMFRAYGLWEADCFDAALNLTLPRH